MTCSAVIAIGVGDCGWIVVENRVAVSFDLLKFLINKSEIKQILLKLANEMSLIMWWKSEAALGVFK